MPPMMGANANPLLAPMMATMPAGGMMRTQSPIVAPQAGIPMANPLMAPGGFRPVIGGMGSATPHRAVPGQLQKPSFVHLVDDFCDRVLGKESKEDPHSK